MNCMPVLGAPARRLEVLITARMATWKLVYSVSQKHSSSERGGVFFCKEAMADRLWKSAKVVSPFFFGVSAVTHQTHLVQ